MMVPFGRHNSIVAIENKGTLCPDLAHSTPRPKSSSRPHALPCSPVPSTMPDTSAAALCSAHRRCPPPRWCCLAPPLPVALPPLAPVWPHPVPTPPVSSSVPLAAAGSGLLDTSTGIPHAHWSSALGFAAPTGSEFCPPPSPPHVVTDYSCHCLICLQPNNFEGDSGECGLLLEWLLLTGNVDYCCS
jgi:hypothetical protein